MDARVSQAIRVLLVDDDALVRSGLQMMLAGAEHIQVVGQAEDGDAVLGAVDLHRPDVVLMDIRMPRVEVALAVGQGLANAEIATELHMSVATVKAHVSRVLAKLEVDNRVQIALLVHDATGGSR
jgi:DNA-binding NarL/FixJ family response regulator